ncbi:MAG: DUF4258 domain-containing protein [Candidatus Methanoperedens sp.]|nr:DUF4258 domain-containing protein [Candidatus Methanoperedens sp.]
MIEIKIIPLALKKADKREISIKMIEETVSNPDQIVSGYGERSVAQKIYKIDTKKMMLRVIYEYDEKYTVITAYLTSQIDKYWSKE